MKISYNIDTKINEKKEISMFNSSVYVGLAIMIAFGIILPVSATIFWLKKHKEKFTTVLIGAAVWFVFAILLESVPKAMLFNPANPIGKAVLFNTTLATILAASLAGIFEETGRFIAFKTLLKKRKNRETSISYGIGHGGFEAMFILVIGAIQNLVYMSLISSGELQTIIDTVAAQGVDVSSLQGISEQLASITPIYSCLGVVERISAMIFHISLSILVFYAVKKSKIILYILAILLHALFDVPAALYQFGVITNMYIVELIFFITAITALIITYKTLYKPDINGTLQEE